MSGPVPVRPEPPDGAGIVLTVALALIAYLLIAPVQSYLAFRAQRTQFRADLLEARYPGAGQWPVGVRRVTEPTWSFTDGVQAGTAWCIALGHVWAPRADGQCHGADAPPGLEP